MADDRLEKVRAEIERRLKLLEHGDANIEVMKRVEGVIKGYKEVLSFINSMQEEPEPHYPSFEESQGEVILYGLNGSVGTKAEPESKVGEIIDLDKLGNKCMYAKDNYTDEDRKVLCKDCEEECEYAKKEPISEDWKEAYRLWCLSHKDGDTLYCIDAWKAALDWQKELFEKNRLKHCNSITNEQAELEQGFIDQHLDKHQRMPTFLDAIEYGMKLMKEQMMKDAVQGFVNAEYQDVVSVKSRAIAGEERKKLGLHLCAKIKLIIIKED